MREIIFDTETTGLDPKTGDRMVEMGCVEMINRVETGKSYHAYYNPDRDMPMEAERVHGLSADFLADKPRFSQTVDELLEFIGDAPLVAHNAQFDFGFLNFELAFSDRPKIGLDRMVDTLSLARKKHPGAKHTLDALCSRYGVDRSHRVKHGALLDAELLAQVYVELTGGRQIGLGLDPQGAGNSNEEQNGSQKVTRGHFKAKLGAFREPRPHAPSPEELGRHKEFLEDIDSPLWTR